MKDFIEKKIVTEKNIGKLINKRRRELNLELKKISRKLNISKKYLEAIENNRLDLLPNGIYGEKYFKKYTEFLNIDENIIKDDLKELSEDNDKNPFSSKKANKKDFIAFPRLTRNITFFIIIILCTLYLSLYAKKIFSPPELSIIYPEENLSTKEKNILIKGYVEKEAEIRINEELILTNSDGYFQKEINLKIGANNIKISAKKKYGNEEIINRVILVE